MVLISPHTRFKNYKGLRDMCRLRAVGRLPNFFIAMYMKTPVRRNIEVGDFRISVSRKKRAGKMERYVIMSDSGRGLMHLACAMGNEVSREELRLINNMCRIHVKLSAQIAKKILN